MKLKVKSGQSEVEIDVEHDGGNPLCVSPAYSKTADTNVFLSVVEHICAQVAHLEENRVSDNLEDL